MPSSRPIHNVVSSIFSGYSWGKRADDDAAAPVAYRFAIFNLGKVTICRSLRSLNFLYVVICHANLCILFVANNEQHNATGINEMLARLLVY